MIKQRVVIDPAISSRNVGLDNARLGMILLVASEIMLFAGLVGGYVVLRFGSNGFAGMQRLAPGLTLISTPILVASSVTLWSASRARRKGKSAGLRLWSTVTVLLGLIFLVLQILEWQSLTAQGILPSVSVSNGMFYLISWVHGLHVAGGLVLLAVLAVRSRRKGGAIIGRTIMEVAGIYWHFVTIVWLALAVMLFLI